LLPVCHINQNSWQAGCSACYLLHAVSLTGVLFGLDDGP
jgi:hypothetical protein